MASQNLKKRTLETHKIIRQLAILMLVVSVVVATYGLVLTVENGVLLKNGAEGEEKAEAIAELAEGIVLLVHYFLVARFLMHMQHHGGIFKMSTAKEVRVIGWETIVLPLAASIVACIAFSGLKLPVEVFEVNAYEMAMGAVLITTGYIIEYATERIEEKEKNN